MENHTQEFNPSITKSEKGNIGLAQINTTIGDIKNNALKVIDYIKIAEEQKLDLIVFPERTLYGNSLDDVVKRFPIIAEQSEEWLNEIATYVQNVKVVLGYVTIQNGDVENSTAVLADGKIETAFLNSKIGFTQINDIKYSILIGEEYLSNPDFCWGKNSDVIINCVSSASRAQKEGVKHNILSAVAKELQKPIVYVNQVGANDGISYDGASRVYQANGELLARAKSFEEQLLVANPLKNIGEIYPLSNGLDLTFNAKNEFTLDYEPDLERTYKTLVQGIRDYFNKTGFKRAVLGLSGGLDSTICAVLLADALGAENVFGVSMPSKLTSDESKNDASELAKNLGINFTQISIKPMYETINTSLQELFKTVEEKWDGRYKLSYTPDNIQARSRATILWGISNEFGSCLPIATSDKSESYMGYATINGDMSGGLAPIADVTKTKLFALARWMNKNRPVENAIPENIIFKPPGAELAIDPKTGKTLIAEDALMPYEFMDEVIWRIENKHETYKQMLNSPFLYETKNNISLEQKTEWLDKFFRRMSTSHYKWSILPPAILVDANSINKCEYSQPITSSKIDYKGM